MAQSLVLPRSHTGAGGVAYKLGTLDFWWRAEGIFLHGVVRNGLIGGYAAGGSRARGARPATDSGVWAFKGVAVCIMVPPPCARSNLETLANKLSENVVLKWQLSWILISNP